MRPQISAIVLTHNNQSSIERTLESISWCDEIVIIDDESTDRTVAMVKKYTDKVFTRELKDDFAAQRNFGVLKAKNEWVLFIDSDETVSQELRYEMETLGNYDGFYIRRTDFFMGRELKYGETANVKLLRLAKKSAGKWVRLVHEVWEVEGQTSELKHPILHYPHPTITEFLSDINRYSTLNAKTFYEEGKRANFITILLYPTAKFIRNYFMLGGFRDGTAGAVMAIMMSFHSFLTRAKLFMLASKP